MRKLLIMLVITLFSFSFMITAAQAKRFGGGKSFGYSRQASSFNRGSYSSPMSAAASRPASTAKKWLAPLAGLAMGGLLASLFMGHGLGTGIMSWLLIAAVVFLIWKLFSTRSQPATQPFQQNMNYQTHSTSSSNANANDKPFFSSSSYPSANLTPSDFDKPTFLRQAKSLFIRLQAAYDTKNLADMREFTAPEVFAEIQLQLQERGDAINQTEVINVDAELLDLVPESQRQIASVLFTGTVREEQGAAPVSIKEIWHLAKNEYQSNWIVLGIQQDH